MSPFFNTEVSLWFRDSSTRCLNGSCLNFCKRRTFLGDIHNIITKVTKFHSHLPPSLPYLPPPSLPPSPLRGWYFYRRHSGYRPRTSKCHAHQRKTGAHSYRPCGTTGHMTCRWHTERGGEGGKERAACQQLSRLFTKNVLFQQKLYVDVQHHTTHIISFSTHVTRHTQGAGVEILGCQWQRGSTRTKRVKHLATYHTSHHLGEWGEGGERGEGGEGRKREKKPRQWLQNSIHIWHALMTISYTSLPSTFHWT